VTAQGIHCFSTHTVRPTDFLEGFTIVFCACVYLAYYVYNLYPAVYHAKVAPLTSPLLILSLHVTGPRVLSIQLIYHLFYQYIDTVIHTAAITQFTNVHTGPVSVCAPASQRLILSSVYKFCSSIFFPLTVCKYNVEARLNHHMITN